MLAVTKSATTAKMMRMVFCAFPPQSIRCSSDCYTSIYAFKRRPPHQDLRTADSGGQSA